MVNRCLYGFFLVFTGVFAGCSDPGRGNEETAQQSGLPANREAAVAQLIDADTRYLETVAERGIAEAYRQHLAPEAIQMLSGYPPIEGRSNIYANFSGLDAEGDAVSLDWELEGVDVAASGELGYTWGTYYYVGPDSDGETGAIEGNYVNIWRKSAAGQWQVILDIENRQVFAEDLLYDESEPDEEMLPEE